MDRGEERNKKIPTACIHQVRSLESKLTHALEKSRNLSENRQARGPRAPLTSLGRWADAHQPSATFPAILVGFINARFINT